MRVLAALVTLAVCSCRLHAHQTRPRDLSHLLSVLGVRDHDPVRRLITCSQELGPSKCLSALSVWRAGKAIKDFQREQIPQFNVTADVEKFPWEKYSNSSEDELYSELCDGAEKLLRHRPLKLTVSGYSLDLESKGDGRFNFNVLKTSEEARGSMKKMEKKFYNILPLLMVPGLIMSAILPFVLPALKLMTVAVGMLNNMALSGAVFTLLRNNAFSHDHYEKRIIYVNEGYKNEKTTPVHFKHVDVSHDDIHEHYGGSTNVKELSNFQGEEYETVEEFPSDSDWINNYYGNEDSINVRRNSKGKEHRIIKHRQRM